MPSIGSGSIIMLGGLYCSHMQTMFDLYIAAAFKVSLAAQACNSYSILYIVQMLGGLCPLSVKVWGLKPPEPVQSQSPLNRQSLSL